MSATKKTIAKSTAKSTATRKALEKKKAEHVALTTRIKNTQQARKQIVALIRNIGEECSMDEEKLNKRIISAEESKDYGSIGGLVNLLCAIASWPADNGDGSNITANKMILEDKFNLDRITMIDAKSFRGYHSFCTDENVIEPGVEPDYENYKAYVEIIIDMLDLDVKGNIITKMVTPERWQLDEEKAKAKAKEQYEEQLRAINDRKALLS